MTSSPNTINSVGEADLKSADNIKDYTKIDGIFIEPDLSQYKPPRFPQPRNIDALITILERQRIIMLSGTSGVDKTELARHVAWYLSTRLIQTNTIGQNTIYAKEWDRNTIIHKVLVAVQTMNNPTIFLLTKVTPQDLQQDDLFHLQESAKRHYIILSTDIAFEHWGLPPDIQTSFWQELGSQNLFTVNALTEMLIARLIEVKDSLPPGIAINNIAPNVALCGSITPTEIIKKLQTCNKIRAFVSFLRGRSTSVAEADLIQIIDKSAYIDAIELYFREWYHNTLDTRSRLLALNLSFFDGLYEDQCFAALEYLADYVWKKRDPQFTAFDYRDLADLDLFFELALTRSGSRVIELRSPEQRRLLLIEAWSNHRRQILAALPYLVMLVKSSVKPRTHERELFGTPTRREKVREVIGATISDIGLIAPDAVQQALVELAIDKNIGVQLVTARALAAWRSYGKDQQLFDVLKDWQKDSYVLDLIRAIQQEHEDQEDERPENYVRATIALTIGKAANYDARNQLHHELITIFVDLSHERNKMVRYRFINYTLPNIITLHLAQVRPQLRVMTKYIDLDWPIASSIALAYRFNSREVMQTLAQWSNECIHTPQTTNIKHITLRETLIATVALAYGEIDYDIDNGPLTADEAFRRLQTILKEESHLFIRTAVVIALTNQAQRDFTRVAPNLQECLADVADHEREEIVAILIKQYTDQRANINGGQEDIVVDKQKFSIWYPVDSRPLTEIETILLEWVMDDRHKVAQQIALQSLIEFERRIDKPIRERIKQIREERFQQQREEDRKAKQEELLKFNKIQTKINWYINHLIPWLVTFNALHYRRVIQTLLPEALRHRQDDAEATAEILDRMENLQDPDLNEVSIRLQQALRLADKKGGIQMGIVVVLIIFLIMACQLIRR